ncbi:MAG: DUF4112 domain-containing protein [Pseudomonadota bacterium]
MSDCMDSFDTHPHAADLARLRKLAVRMDSAYRVPGTSIRLGWDAILGLVPVVGDVLTLAPSVFILRESHRMGAPAHLLARMGINTGIDVILGSIPLVGDIFDIGWQSKTRNVNLLHKHLARASKAKEPPQGTALSK